eukprot:scaffold5520_cov167-Amphora_coffeaeformis.AAC.14
MFRGVGSIVKSRPVPPAHAVDDGCPTSPPRVRWNVGRNIKDCVIHHRPTIRGQGVLGHLGQCNGLDHWEWRCGKKCRENRQTNAFRIHCESVL